MTFEKTYEVKNKHQLVIKLPDHFKSKRKVRVIIEDVEDKRADKIKMLKNALKDPLFLSDINETSEDFKDSDNELI